MSKEIDVIEKVMRIYTDGAGCRPGGKGSGYAWICPDTLEKKIVRVDDLTNNQAEYRAILDLVEYLPAGSKAEILTDSENTCFQLRGERRTLNPHLSELRDRILWVANERNLSLIFIWIPRRENLAGKLL